VKETLPKISPSCGPHEIRAPLFRSMLLTDAVLSFLSLQERNKNKQAVSNI